jgi:ferrous iron transport protein A
VVRIKKLACLHSNQSAKIIALPEGHFASQRLREMGLRPGLTVQMLHNHGKGPVLIQVLGCRLALGRGLAQKIDIEMVAASAMDTNQGAEILPEGMRICQPEKPL